MRQSEKALREAYGEGTWGQTAQESLLETWNGWSTGWMQR